MDGQKTGIRAVISCDNIAGHFTSFNTGRNRLMSTASEANGDDESSCQGTPNIPYKKIEQMNCPVLELEPLPKDKVLG